MEKGKEIQVMALSLMLLSVIVLIGTAYGVTHLGWSFYWLTLPLLPLGFGGGCMGASNQTQAMMDVPPAHGGTAGGLQQTTQRITTAIGNALITGVLFSTYRGGSSIASWFTGFASAQAVIVVFLACALALAVTFLVRTSHKNAG